MLLRRNPNHPRRGVILLVVISLLALFAIVGLAFVYYAQSAADSARVYRESFARPPAGGPDVPASELLDEFLRQLIYDVPDTFTGGIGGVGGVGGVSSALRGHSLGRTIYGWNSASTNASPLNTTPYDGIGRLHHNYTVIAPTPMGTFDDYKMVNYTYFYKFAIHDPERPGWRISIGLPVNTWTGGFNPSYTYPDLNNMFLAAVKADGTVLTPSYHRKWLFNPNNALNDKTNANWINGLGKFLILRPRPSVEMDPTFPYPADATGDVKNLIGAPGGNDSIWIDIGSPIRIAQDGTLYKPLFAPLVVDFDNRLNVNVHGNVRGKNTAHVSNQGWGPWEVNLQYVLSKLNGSGNNEWPNVFLGNGTNAGRYGLQTSSSPQPQPQDYLQGGTASSGSATHFYNRVDLDGCDETNSFNPSGTVTLSGSGWPTYGNGYGDGSNAERTNHPLLFNFFQPDATPQPPSSTNPGNSVFDVSNMRALLHNGSAGGITEALNSPLGKLLPTNIGDPAGKIRRMITTHSFDLDQAGVTPWVYSPTAGTYTVPAATPDQAPTGAAIAYQTLPTGGNTTGEFATNGSYNFKNNNAIAITKPFSNNLQVQNNASPPPTYTVTATLNTALLGEVDLNRTLTPYPSYSNSSYPQLVPYYGRYDDHSNLPAVKQFLQAQTDRQNLAQDIYDRLVKVTGAYVPASGTVTTSSDPNLIPLRWLAQLSVNIVDFIDEDDISTPFNFYPNGLTGVTAQLPAYWVFGTEMPSVVVNEALAEYEVPQAATATLTKPKYYMKFWVELANPLSNTTSGQASDGQPAPLTMTALSGTSESTASNTYTAKEYPTYQVVIAKQATGVTTPPFLTPTTNENVLGEVTAATVQFQTAIVNSAAATNSDFGHSAGKVVQVGSGVPPSPLPNTPPWPFIAANNDPTYTGFFLLGPKADPTTSLFPGPNTGHGNIKTTGPDNVPAGTPWLQSPNMAFLNTTVTQVAPTLIYSPNPPTDVSTDAFTVMLRRLANPHIPYKQTPSGNYDPWYNPYITVDYMENISGTDMSNLATAKNNSRGKLQPYASYWSAVAANSQVQNQGLAATVGTTKHTFGQKNNNQGVAAGPYDWLVHLDRQLNSPMELLQVSGYQPYQLTHRFVQNTPNAPLPLQPPDPQRFRHQVPWFDETNRLARVFSFLSTKSRAAGVQFGGRIPGKININTVWDKEIFESLCDPQNGNSNAFQLAEVDNVFNAFLNLRTPGGSPGPTSAIAGLAAPAAGYDRPVWGMAAPNCPAGDTQFTGYNAAGAAVNTFGINNTLLASNVLGGASTTQRLFQTTTAGGTATPVNPYYQFEMLSKTCNNLTTRSNVFGVWLTVGFFKVTNTGPTAIPYKLGVEVGAAGGTNIRHHLFAVVDRSTLTLLPDDSNSAGWPSTTSNGQVTSPGSTTVQLPNSCPIASQIKPGTVLTIDTGANKETVIVTAINPVNPNNSPPPTSFSATFRKSHVTGVPIVLPPAGNPGPQPQFSAKDNAAVVLYYSVID